MKSLKEEEKSENEINKKSTYSVYIHTNKINNKKYVGITCQNINKRWRNGEGYKTSPYFYNSIKKNGWDSFSHEIIFEDLTEEDAKVKEIELIFKYNTTDNFYGYNQTKGGEGSVGYKHTYESKLKIKNSKIGSKWSDEQRCKMIEIMTGRNLTEDWRQKISESHIGHKNPSAKSIFQLNSKYELIKEFSCARYAEKELNINVVNISQVCLGQGKSAGGYIFMFKNDYESQKDNLIGKSVNINPYRKEIIQLTLGGDEINRFSSISEAAKLLNIDPSSISNVCKGRRQITAGNYKWKYA